MIVTVWVVLQLALVKVRLAGETVERCYAIGFHDGDVMRLGRGTQEGYVNEPTFDCW